MGVYASVRGRPEVKVALEFVRIEPDVIPKKTLNGGVSRILSVGCDKAPALRPLLETFGYPGRGWDSEESDPCRWSGRKKHTVRGGRQ